MFIDLCSGPIYARPAGSNAQQITARGEEGMVSAQLVRNTDWIHIVVRDEAFDTLAPLYQQLGGDMVRVENTACRLRTYS